MNYILWYNYNNSIYEPCLKEIRYNIEKKSNKISILLHDPEFCQFVNSSDRSTGCDIEPLGEFQWPFYVLVKRLLYRMAPCLPFRAARVSIGSIKQSIDS